MNALKFKIFPSLETNDHEVRIFIDEADWLREDSLGVDPPRFFAQDALRAGGKLLVGRCICGCEGCCDTWVSVGIAEDVVSWTNHRGWKLSFSREAYCLEVARAAQDFSWEDEGRTVERLVGEVFSNSGNDGFVFDWASARDKTGVITLSFSKNGAQKLIEFGWMPGSIEDAVSNARRVQREMFAK